MNDDLFFYVFKNQNYYKPLIDSTRAGNPSFPSLPKDPSSLHPQVYTWPVSVTTALCKPPRAIEHTFLSLRGASTRGYLIAMSSSLSIPTSLIQAEESKRKQNVNIRTIFEVKSRMELK